MLIRTILITKMMRMRIITIMIMLRNDDGEKA